MKDDFSKLLKLRWYLAEKRLRWQRPAFYNALDLPAQVHFYISTSLFLRTVELDAAIYAYTGEVEKLKRCLERKVSPNLCCLMDNAIEGNKVPVAKLLLDAGANPNQTIDSAGTTLLYRAVCHGNPEMVELLLAKGADPNLENHLGVKPFWEAWEKDKGKSALIKLLEPVTKFDPPKYNVDEFLKMENPEKAYWALSKAIMDGYRRRTPAELRVLSLADFTGNCLTNGFWTFDGNARWAIVPAAELMDAIDEPALARGLWEGIAIMREYGTQVGRDPFDEDADYVALDDETENKIEAMEFDFLKYGDLIIDKRLYRKTMDYVRKNRELFAPKNMS